ncbi:MAG: hypothetical protein AB1416_03155, partial [Actinomycetota bacterium]
AAALLRQSRRAAGQPAGVVDLRADLLARCRDLGAPGPDTTYGAGLARLDVAAPRPTVRIGRGPRPLVWVRALDDGTVADVRIRLAGREVARRRGPRARLRLPATARPGATVEVLASDLAGNVGRRVTTIPRTR